MTQELLHGANVITRLEQVRGEGVPQGVRRGRLGDAGVAERPLERTLKSLFVDVVAALQVRARIDEQL